MDPIVAIFLFLVAAAFYISYLILKAIFNFIIDLTTTTTQAVTTLHSNVMEGSVKPFISSITFNKQSDIVSNIDFSTFLDYEYKEELVVKVLTMIAFSSAKINASESNVIKDYIKIQMDKREVFTNYYKMKMDQAIIDASALVTSKKYPIYDMGEKFQFNFTIDERMDILEWCMKILSSDDEINKDEIATLNAIASAFGVKLDHKRFTAIKDKQFLKGNFSDNSIEGLELELGIDSNLSVKEKKKVVVQLYKKWNSRLNILKDKDDRKKAQKYLDSLGLWRSLHK